MPANFTFDDGKTAVRHQEEEVIIREYVPANRENSNPKPLGGVRWTADLCMIVSSAGGGTEGADFPMQLGQPGR